MNQRVLLIEDSPTQLLTIKRTLEGEGFVVISASNGAEGLARAYNESPDLIVSDVVMSGINGYQICRLVKHDPDLSSTPVILLTKLDGSIDRFWGLKSGADRYIPKEAGFPSLIKAVHEIMGEVGSRPRLRVLADPAHTLSSEEIDSRLHQLLERLLFEATISDEVRRIGDDILDLEVMSEKLFALLETILNYMACVLVVNQGLSSALMMDLAKESQSKEVKSYVSKVALQVGLPPLEGGSSKIGAFFEEALTQPIDTAGLRVGLLVVIPWPGSSYKAGDQKVVRMICEQLSVLLRLYLSHAQHEGKPVSTGFQVG